MKEKPYLIVNTKGEISEANKAAVHLLGIPTKDLKDGPFAERLIAEHRVRFTAEIDAITEGLERHARLHCTVIGLDGIGRRLTLGMNTSDRRTVHITLSPYLHPDTALKAPGSSLLDPGRLLPVARRISAVSRRATDRKELLSTGLEVLAEVVSADGGAALEWEEQGEDQPIIAIGNFNPHHLKGVFRPAVLARLNRGDVVVKEGNVDGQDTDTSLIIIPLLSTAAPVGVIVLSVHGYSVLVPEEQQSFVILGEIIGLGLKSLTPSSRHGNSTSTHRGDAAASIALGRLCAGLTHEINNATTVLRNNLEQLMLRTDSYGHGSLNDSVMKDSKNALKIICDLNDALSAFAPEETNLLEEIDILRLLDMVVRSVRFYAKRGMDVILNRPKEDLPFVLVRSHYLIRSLFLILVELVEASVESGIDLTVIMALTAADDLVTLTIEVTAGPFSLPTILIAQLEKGGALNRHVDRAGGKLTHSVDDSGNLSMSITLPDTKHLPSSTPPHPSAAPPRRGTILVAEDDMAVIRSLRRLLERNHDVLAARSGEEALDIIKAHPEVEIVLYDASMPRLASPEFFEELKRLQLPVADQVIFVTGGAADADISRFLAETTNHVIDKPFNIALLNELISSMLQ